MNVKRISASIAAVAAIAAASNNAAATLHYDRYSGFACEGNAFVDYPDQGYPDFHNHPYDWAPGTTGGGYYGGFFCPITNWFPGGLADVTDVYVQMTTPHASAVYDCDEPKPDYTGPSAKACVIYASYLGSTYGSGCSPKNETLANSSAGANYIHLSSSYLSAWNTGYPLGGAYVVVREGGYEYDPCISSPATFRTLTVISDI